MKYVSYSLWGNNPIYCIGAIKNMNQIKEIYPDWQMIIYYDNTVPEQYIQELKDGGVICVDVTGESYGMFWRFFTADLPDCEYVIFRDCDSRLSMREKAAVDEWILSKKSIHVMRDHPAHRIPYGNDTLGILGGMWGIKGNVIPLKQSILRFSKDKKLDYGIDQTFLKNIYNIFNNDMCVHDEFFSNKPFPIKREGQRFIGERIGIDDKPSGHDHLQIPLQ
mgnify:FL=1|jgi:hypothetical protein